MSEKKGQKNDEEEEKEGTLDADALDGAFDDHGFGDEDEVIPVVVDPENTEKEDDDAEWNSYDDNKDW